MARVVLRNISKTYQNDVIAVHDVSLDVGDKEFVALVGPSGSGKSTLLRIINGLIPPTEGRILYQGRELRSVNLDSAIVVQSFALFPWLTVLGLALV